MMNTYDEIFQIFESQKQEISKLSNKVNELEETNAFLITILEKNQTLPPIYDPNLLRKDKAAAIEKEYSLRSLRDKHSNVDSTHCETTLNDSFDGNIITNNPNSFRWSTDSSSNKKLISPTSKSDTMIKSFEIINISDEMKKTSQDKLSLNLSSKSTNLNLRMSRTPPIRKPTSKNILLCNADTTNSVQLSKDYSSDNKTSNSDDGSDSERDFLDSVIAKSVNEIISETEDKPSFDKTEKFHVFPKMNDSQPPISFNESSLTNTIVSSPGEKSNLKKALDNLIETLQNNTATTDITEPLQGSMLSPDYDSNKSIVMYSDYLNELITNKDACIADINDKHTQMKLLLTTQQLRADLLHQSLEENSKFIFNHLPRVTQNNTSNICIPPNQPISREPIDEVSEVTSSNTSMCLADLKLYRQKELSRLNLKSNDQTILENPKVKNGFIKFTALVKGYIVRTLCETDKVQNIIMIIKDTAHLAIKLRQERLSGDCPQSDDYNPYGFGNRRNNQEIISFQQRLVAQIKTALCELHEVFFDWSSAMQMRLIRHHIAQLMITGCNTDQPTNENHATGPSTVNNSKPRTVAKLSTATLKRRQKLALRSTDNKEIGNKNTNSSATSRKSAYKASYGCRGYGVGANSRAPNSHSKIATDRKPRSNNVTRRRCGIRTITKSDINKISSNTKSNTTENKSLKAIETNTDKSEPDFVSEIEPDNYQLQQLQQRKEYLQQQQQSQQTLHAKQLQQRVQPKTITTSVCSPKSINRSSSNGKNNFINVKSNGLHDPIHIDGYSTDDSFNTNKFALNQLPVGPDNQSRSTIDNISKDPDWKCRTYTLPNNNIKMWDKTNKDNDKIWSSKQTISDDTSNRSISDFNENSVSKVEVDINDIDMGYLCQNNSHYNEYYDDITEQQNIVLVDVTQSKDTKLNSHKLLENSPIIPSHYSSSNKSNSKIFNYSKNPSKSKTNNVVLSNALNNVKPEFYISMNSNLPDKPVQFKIRKRIVACSSLYSSTVSHS